VIGTLAVDGWAVTFGTAIRGLDELWVIDKTIDGTLHANDIV